MLKKITISLKRNHFLSINYDLEVFSQNTAQLHEFFMIPDRNSLINLFHFLIFVPSEIQRAKFSLITPYGTQVSEESKQGKIQFQKF